MENSLGICNTVWAPLLSRHSCAFICVQISILPPSQIPMKMASSLLNDKKRKRQLTPGESSGAATIRLRRSSSAPLALPLSFGDEKRKRELTTDQLAEPSPAARGWSLIFREISKVRILQDAFLHRLHIRGDIFHQLSLVRFQNPGVREELHKWFCSMNLPPRSLPNQNIPARYRLKFTNNVNNPIFTTDEVPEGVPEGKAEPIAVEIHDLQTGSIVSDNSFLSCAGVRFTVVDAEFWTNKGEHSSRTEFNQSMLREREGRGSILTCGGHVFQLKNGRGSPGIIKFGDNSSKTRSGFRLGVMLVEVEGQMVGYFNGERVQEGVSNSFWVKDRRGKAFQKPKKLELQHSVRYLKKVGRDRAKLLEEKSIKTVKNFLDKFHENKAELLDILHFKSDSDNSWIAMVRHAMECDKEFQNGFSNTNQPQQVPVEEHNNILNIDSNQSSFPINNANQVSPSDEVMTWINTPQDQSSNCSEDHVNRLETYVPLVTNGGSLLVGSGSSEPNPSVNNIINQALQSHLLDSPANPLHFHDTNHMTTGGNMLDFMQDDRWLRQFAIPDDWNPMDDLLGNAGSIPDANVYVGPLSSRRKVRIKALLKSITWLAVPRKRARTVPPANQTTVPALKA